MMIGLPGVSTKAGVKENGYEVVLVGHSLGAAVAAACCVQLRAGPGALRTARCVCYAPPATVDPNQAAEAASYITSVVHDDDCIPRMSILSLLELYKSVVSYNWLPQATSLVGKMRADAQQAWFLEVGDNAFKKTLEEQLESIWKEQAGQLAEEVKKLEKPRQEAHPLSIPGFIVHLYRLGKLILSRQAQQVSKVYTDFEWAGTRTYNYLHMLTSSEVDENIFLDISLENSSYNT